MGPYRGGQAQYLRVPYADFNALKLPPGTDHEEDFITLAEIFPTGWHGVVLSGFKPGESIAVWGAGPVPHLSSQLIPGRYHVGILCDLDGCITSLRRRSNPRTSRQGKRDWCHSN